MNEFKLDVNMIKWLDARKSDYKYIAIDNQTFPSSAQERASQIAKSPHSMLERRRLIQSFCEEFNMLPLNVGVPEAIRMISEWKDIKKT